MPRILLHDFLSRKNADQEIRQKDELRSKKNERRDRNENVQRLLRLEEVIVGRIVNAAHLPADSENVHREEHAIHASEAQPEVQFAKRFIHEPAEHLREPEIE